MSTEAQTESTPALNEWTLTDATLVGLVLVAALIIGFWSAPGPRTIAPTWPHATYFQRSQLSLLIALIVQLGAVTAVVAAICKLRGMGDPLSSIGWNLNGYVGTSALAGLGLAAVISVALYAVYGGIERFRDGMSPLSILLYVVSTVLIQPFVEECYFRGILFSAASRKFGQFGAVALTALLFALFHVGGYRLVLVFVIVGVVLAIARIKTRSVASCFALHAGYNFGVLISGLIRTR